MIYIHENVIYYYGECDLERRLMLVRGHLILWQAKRGNKYWKQELRDNVVKKIELHKNELKKLEEIDVNSVYNRRN